MRWKRIAKQWETSAYKWEDAATGWQETAEEWQKRYNELRNHTLTIYCTIPNSDCTVMGPPILRATFEDIAAVVKYGAYPDGGERSDLLAGTIGGEWHVIVESPRYSQSLRIEMPSINEEDNNVDGPEVNG